MWKRYAGQIEADLHGRADIADWHQGTTDEHGRLRLSSRKLLILLKYSRDDTAFAKDGFRGGRMSRWQWAIEQVFNEQLRLRSSYEAVASHGKIAWDPADYAMLDPVDEHQRVTRHAVEAAEEEHAFDTFYSDLGFS